MIPRHGNQSLGTLLNRRAGRLLLVLLLAMGSVAGGAERSGDSGGAGGDTPSRQALSQQLGEQGTNRGAEANAHVAAAGGKQATRTFQPLAGVNFREPAREYVERLVGPRNFRVEKALTDRDPELARRALERLNAKLDLAFGLLPGHSHTLLNEIRFILLLGKGAEGGGFDNGTEYFRRTDPDYRELLDSRWRRVIVIYSAENYLAQTDHWAVLMLLHELAHAWQLERWPERQLDIVAAWEQAKAAGRYQRVRDVNGDVVESAYAISNALEYFAELSCAYFWRGEYEPFDREALKKYDPPGFRMIEKMWGIHEAPPAGSERAGEVE